MMPGSTEGCFVTPRRTIHYRAHRGPGPAVLLLHGMGATSAVWTEVIDILGGVADVIAVDLHGVGGTTAWSQSRRMGLEDEADLVLSAARAAFGDRPVHVVGHGYGAAVGLCAAVLAPAALVSLSLVDPTSIALLERLEPDGDAVADIKDQYERFLGWMERGHAAEAMAGWAAHYLGATVWPWLERSERMDLIELARPMTHQWHAMASDRTAFGDLRGLAVPLLILCGSKTPAHEARLAQILHGHAPVGRFELMPGAGHDSPRSHPTMIAGLWTKHWLVDREPRQHRAGAVA